MTHPFWGEIKGDSTVALFAIPGFTPAVKVSFANVTHAAELTDAALDGYADVFKSFIATSESLVGVVSAESFVYYQRVYARYFEHPELSGEAAFCLTTPELHYGALKELLGVVLSVRRSVELDFAYDVDEEHGLCVMFLDNCFYRVGGIAEIQIDAEAG